jgi:NTP pyrophosphatase (non-canonical NTP hydrolase)
MIELPPNATMADFQTYVHELEALHGWLDVDLVHNCFRMGEEVGELFKAVRCVNEQSEPPTVSADVTAKRLEDVSEEIVDVLNYLLAIANRLDIDVEAAFRKKNTRNQSRTWD